MLFNPKRPRQTTTCDLTALGVLLLHLLLAHSCRGQLQLIGSSEPIVATLGDDVTLPCRLQPEDDASGLTLEWARPDLDPRFVHMWRSGQELVSKKHKSFQGRTSLFVDELQVGNISLKLSKVTLADRGTYKCFVPGLERQTLVQLVVVPEAASSQPTITVWMDRSSRGVVLDCESGGWYPEPELLWLDAEGNLLSAGPPETTRGPDDLYTVSSRVTVEKRHSNRFTCRVHQKTTNHTREAHVTVPEDLFERPHSYVPIITGLAVSVTVNILLLLFMVWRWRLTTKNQTQHSGSDEGEEVNRSTSPKPGDQSLTAERERETLVEDGTLPMKLLKDNGRKKSKHFQKKRSKQQMEEERREEEMREEEMRRQEAEKELTALKETKKNEVETKDTELKNLMEELENKNKELYKSQISRGRSFMSLMTGGQKGQQRTEVEILKEKVEKLETLKEKLQTQQQKSNNKIKKMEEQQQAANSQWKKTNEELNEAKRELEIKKGENSQLKNNVSSDRPMQEDSSSANHSSTTGPVIEFNHQGQYINLRNTSH